MKNACLNKQLNNFHTDGYVKIENVFSKNALNKISNKYQKTIEKYKKESRVDSCNSLDWAMIRDEDIEYLVGKEIINIIKRISSLFLNLEENQFSLDLRIFNKPSKACQTPLHQDKAYEPQSTQRRINFWVPLDSIHSENGALYYIKGSHLNGIVDHQYNYINNVKYLRVDNIDIDNKNVIYMKQGDIVVHNDLVLHGAESNRTNIDRPTIVFIAKYQG